MKKSFRKNKGITLVALVVTIIVLIILAAVGISSLSGGDGLINKAKEAVENFQKVANEEENILANLENTFESGNGWQGGSDTPPQKQKK